MAITQVSDVFDPQVIADITTDILFREVRLINSPFVTDGSSEIYRDGGNTLTFPSWNTTTTGLVQDQVSTRTGVTPSKISMTSYTEEVVDKIISFDANKHVFQDILQSANPNFHMAQLVAEESRLEMQRALIGKAEGTSLIDDASYVHATAADQLLTVDSILRAKMAWGEKASGLTPGLFVHSKQYEDLAQTDDFKSLATATLNNPIVQAQFQQGAVAMVHGTLIYLLDSITAKGGTVSGIARSGAVATLTTAAAHGYVVGDRIVVSGATQTEYNGTVTVVTVPTDTTLTYAVSGTPDTPATGSPAVATSYEALMMLPSALSLVLKQGVMAEEHRHAGSPIRTLDFDFRYATTLRRVNPRRVVRFRTR